MNAVEPAATAQDAKVDPRSEGGMRREIGVMIGILLVVNATIGTGIFKTPAKVARQSGSLGAALGVWAVGAVIALCGALTMAELSAAIPRTGGIYEYLRRTWGDLAAFLFGWAKLTLLIPSAVGSFAKLAAEAATSLAGLPPNARRDGFVALGFLAAATGVNLLGVRTSARQQGIITAAKYLGVVALAVVGLLLPVHGEVPAPVKADAFAVSPTVLGCFAALVSVMWAYDGWADLASLSGEVKNPGRSLPRALVAGTIAIAVVYLAANLGYARSLGLEGLRRSTTGAGMAAAHVATLTLGELGRRGLSALILLSCLGGCMSSLMTGSRVFVPLATDGLFFRGLGELTPATRVPTRAVLVSAGLGGVYVLWRSFEQLTDAFVVGYFPFYVMAIASVVILRKREPNLERPFRVPGYPVVPALFVVGAIALMVGAFADADRTALWAMGVLAIGVPVGLLFRRMRAVN